MENPLTADEKSKQLDALERSIYEGVLKIEYSDKKMEFRSLKEMIEIRDMLRRDLGQKISPSRKFSYHNKGL